MIPRISSAFQQLFLGPTSKIRFLMTDWNVDFVSEGKSEDVFFPFDALTVDAGDTSAYPELFMLNEGTVVGSVIPTDEFGLVKAGVESPVGFGDPVGSRDLSRFSFTIEETNQFSVPDVEAAGHDSMKRHGVPGDAGKKKEFLGDWRALPVDPNRSYMMVITFYESLPAIDENSANYRNLFLSSPTMTGPILSSFPSVISGGLSVVL